jgi:hypothetical protein
VSDAVRTVRRYPGGTVVSVQLRGRPHEAIAADMVEGVVVTNRLTGDAALRARTLLAESLVGIGTAERAPAPRVLVDRHAA